MLIWCYGLEAARVFDPDNYPAQAYRANIARLPEQPYFINGDVANKEF